MKYVVMIMITLIALAGCSTNKPGTKKMDQKRYDRQITDAQKSVDNIDN